MDDDDYHLINYLICLWIEDLVAKEMTKADDIILEENEYRNLVGEMTFDE